MSGGYGEHYADGCTRGKMRLFSYRTGSAQPHITINAWVGKDGLLQIDQIKGKQNRPPIARYATDVVRLLNHLPLNTHVPDDTLAMGVVRRPTEMLAEQPALAAWCAVSELHSEAEQLWLIQQHPELMAQLTIASPLVQWMVAARKESVDAAMLERMPKSPALQHALQLARKRPRKAMEAGT